MIGQFSSVDLTLHLKLCSIQAEASVSQIISHYQYMYICNITFILTLYICKSILIRMEIKKHISKNNKKSKSLLHTMQKNQNSARFSDSRTLLPSFEGNSWNKVTHDLLTQAMEGLQTIPYPNDDKTTGTMVSVLCDVFCCV